MSTIGNFSPLAMNAISVWPRTADTLIHYVYPGAIDVSLGAGIRFQTRGDSHDVELGAFLGKGEVSAEMWMDDALWKWQDKAAARRAQVWVKHVMVADLLGLPQGYEFEGELVLVGIRIPSRQVESLLLQAGFQPSLATWRAKASDERRRRLPEFVAWIENDGPEEPRPAAPEAAASKSSGEIKELKDRAQHVWMRWYVLFQQDLVTAGRTYQMRGRPTLDDRELVLMYRHPSSGDELALRFDVAGHPLHHKATAAFDNETVVREGLAWAEYSEFVTAVGDAIKPRSATRKAPRSTAKPSAKRAATEATPRSPLPAEKREEARTQIEDLVLSPPRRSAFLARVDRAAERGESPRRLVTEATKESREFMRERAANRSQEPTWDEAVAEAFEQEPGWRLDVVPRGQGHMLSVYPDGGAPGDAVASIDVRGIEIGDVRWSSGILPAQQDDLLRRVQRALQAAHAVKLGNLPVSPLLGRIEAIRRRAGELGLDPDRSAYGVMARALEDLAEPSPDAPGDLIRWLRGTHADHRALSLIEAWRDMEGPADAASLSSDLWRAVLKDMVFVHAHEGRLETACDAPFTTHDGKKAVLLLHPRPRGGFELFKMSSLVQNTGDPTICQIEDDAGELRDGDRLLLIDSERQADEQIELYQRIAGFLAEVERTPERLQDVRRLLFLTAAMIDTPRCKGAHRAAAMRAFEKARDYYDTARRSLARGAALAATDQVHDALRRIGLAAASIAEACAEGQEPLGARVSSEHAPRIEPSEADLKTMRAVEAAEKQARPPDVTAGIPHVPAGAQVAAVLPSPVASAPTRARHTEINRTEIEQGLAPCMQRDPIAQARDVLARAGIDIDPAKLRTVGRLGECCAPSAVVRDRARKALRDAGIHASIVRERLLFPLVQA